MLDRTPHLPFHPPTSRVPTSFVRWRVRILLLAFLVVAFPIYTEPAMASDRSQRHGFFWQHPGADSECLEDGSASFADFSDSTDLRLNGSAWNTAGELRLTAGHGRERGSAFLREAAAFGPDTSFETHAVFRMGANADDSGLKAGRGHGLTFTLQSWSPRALGLGRGGLGYAMIFPSLAVELDTRKNRWDPNANHVGVNLFGRMQSFRTASPGFELADGKPHGLWVDYDATEKTLRVYVSEDPDVRPSRPLISMRNGWLTRLLAPRVFAGFTASSGPKGQAVQAIESWSFSTRNDCPCVTDLDCDDETFCNGQETCSEGSCLSAPETACGDATCDEELDECILEPRRIEVGTVQVSSEGTLVSLSEAFVQPVVVATVQHRNNSIPVVARVSSVDGGGFFVRIQNPSGEAVVPETVSWVAVERGAWEVDGVRFEAQTVNSAITDFRQNWVGRTVDYLQSYTQPVVLGQVMTDNDPRWSVFWARGDQLGNPPTADFLIVGKSVAEDPQTDRADETLGLIVFEAGHGIVGGLGYEAGVGEDIVRGVDDDAPYAYSFATPFESPPTVGVVSLAGVDGLGGGWAENFGETLATTEQLFLAIDEDQLRDVERGHATEQVAYLVFVRATGN